MFMVFLAIFLIPLVRAYFEFHWFAIHLFLFIYLETAMKFTFNASAGANCTKDNNSLKMLAF